MSALLKKPKRESVEIDDDDEVAAPNKMMSEENGDPDNRQDQEDALVALIEHRMREVEENRRRVDYYSAKVSFPPFSYGHFR